MTLLESKITELLCDIEGLLEPCVVEKEKWQIISKTQKKSFKFVDLQSSLTNSCANSSRAIMQLTSYKNAEAVFERDSVFAKAQFLVNYHGSFYQLIQLIVSKAGSLKKDKVVIDVNQAILLLRDIRKTFTQKTLNFNATARLFGVSLTGKLFKLPDGIELYRLSRKELNDCQPIYEPFLSSALSEMSRMDHFVNVCTSVVVPVDHKEHNAFIMAKFRARDIAHTVFSEVVSAILVAMPGKVQLGEIHLLGDIEYVSISQNILRYILPSVDIKINKNSVANISSAYALVSGGKLSDKTLSRSIHRFLLGRKRGDLDDKLVDYVIAWEALVLTNEGQPIAQELSYRFSLNGAAIITKAGTISNSIDVYKKLKGAYSVRSAIVHGVSTSDIAKKLAAGGYNDTKELCDYLEEMYRAVIYWLFSMKPKERPYMKQNGWEHLIWHAR